MRARRASRRSRCSCMGKLSIAFEGMDEAAKKSILRKFTYGLYAITVRHGERRNAFTANWVTQVSFEPPMVALAVENDGESIHLIEASGQFAVNALAAGQRELAGSLGRKSKNVPQKLEGCATFDSPAGLPLLREALGWLECRVTAKLPAGDHTVYVAEVTEAGQLRDEDGLTMKETGFRYFG
jgi:flavin reductase (DIM6/NTAB) family NADH-FMN oxidoreductase RutF